jgi:ABC-type nickel/cobalt efflux system permease component RcnA
VRIARPILLVSTPIGLIFGLREAWRLAGPGMAVLMAVLLAIVGAFIWMTVRTIRRERANAQTDSSRRTEP